MIESRLFCLRLMVVTVHLPNSGSEKEEWYQLTILSTVIVQVPPGWYGESYVCVLLEETCLEKSNVLRLCLDEDERTE